MERGTIRGLSGRPASPPSASLCRSSAVFRSGFRRAGLDVDRLSDGDVLASLKGFRCSTRTHSARAPSCSWRGTRTASGPNPFIRRARRYTAQRVLGPWLERDEFCNIQRLWRWARFRIGQPYLDLRSRPLSGMENHAVLDGDFRYIRNRKVNGLEFSSDFKDDSNIARYHALLCAIATSRARASTVDSTTDRSAYAQWPEWVAAARSDDRVRNAP